MRTDKGGRDSSKMNAQAVTASAIQSVRLPAAPSGERATSRAAPGVLSQPSRLKLPTSAVPITSVNPSKCTALRDAVSVRDSAVDQ
jgi:hypothetical protein